jgi:lysophospholipase
VKEGAPFHADVASAPDGARAFWLETSDGVRIRMVAWDKGTRGTAYVFPGRTEYVEKYGRVAGEVAALGLRAVVVDWRGQGLSDRLGATRMQGHVGDFAEFQRDVAAVTAATAALGFEGPAYLIAHSMGGGIGLRTLMETKTFRAAIMSAPMWRLQLRTAAREAAARVIRGGNALGLNRRISVVSSTHPAEASGRFEGNALTTDPEMFAWARKQVETYPDLALGPPGSSWTRAAILEMLRLESRPLPDVPFLLFAGTGDRVVSVPKIRSRARRLPDARLVEFQGARHEIFMERAEVRRKVWSEIAAFLDRVEYHPT